MPQSSVLGTPILPETFTLSTSIRKAEVCGVATCASIKYSPASGTSTVYNIKLFTIHKINR